MFFTVTELLVIIFKQTWCHVHNKILGILLKKSNLINILIYKVITNKITVAVILKFKIITFSLRYPFLRYKFFLKNKIVARQKTSCFFGPV